MSYKNGISFHGDKITVNSRINKDRVQEIDFEIKGNIIINRIPLLRRYFGSLKSTLLSMLLLVIFIIVDFYSNYKNELGMMAYIFTIVLILGLCIFQNKSLSGFHGAEHKAINAYYYYNTISIDNIKKSPRIAKQCGTNSIIMMIFIMLIFNIALREFYFTLLFFIYGLTRELFTIRNLNKCPLFFVVFRIGDFLQDRFLTSEPSDEQLDLAKNAIEKLIFCEENALDKGSFTGCIS
ncbi:MAG: DUF1385 domain-containing protein [Methanobacteriaceae archaeon]|nr:DUF1385 domain-containing protein [Methanobacteriaceae archaeon]